MPTTDQARADPDPANRDPNYPTNNNRLMRYEESVDNGQGGWTLTRTVKYVYYITGHASNIIIKDAADPWHRGLALYYTSAGKLWRAVWEQWQVNEQQQVTDYTRTGGREFYYDGPRERYLSRAMDVSSEYPSQWKPTQEPQLWTDYLGDEPAGDFAVVEKQDPQQRWYIESRTETLGYVPGYGTHAQQDAQTGATRYLHGDLIRSTMLTTDEGGLPDETLAYTAFGEPVTAAGLGWPPTSATRYRYAGGYGYEDDLLSVQGASTSLGPILLQHVGYRWYQAGTGRFIQRDPLGLLAGSLNLYQYCHGNPVTCIDPTGLWDFWRGVIGGVVGGVVGALVGGLTGGPAGAVAGAISGGIGGAIGGGFSSSGGQAAAIGAVGGITAGFAGGLGGALAGAGRVGAGAAVGIAAGAAGGAVGAAVSGGNPVVGAVGGGLTGGLNASVGAMSAEGAANAIRGLGALFGSLVGHDVQCLVDVFK